MNEYFYQCGDGRDPLEIRENSKVAFLYGCTYAGYFFVALACLGSSFLMCCIYCVKHVLVCVFQGDQSSPRIKACCGDSHHLS